MSVWVIPFSTFLVGFLTFLLGVFVTHRLKKNDEKRRFIGDYIEDIRAIEKMAVEYWSENTTISSKRDKDLEELLIAHLDGLFMFIQHDCPLQKKIKSECDLILPRLWTAVTGGTFQTKNRRRDSHRLLEITRLFAELVSKLRQSKTKYFL